jgi:glyoxylase-like metal-dependent hydrolase (beta-lactamase superfamily II)
MTESTPFPKPLAQGIFGWSRYEPAAKVDCHSTVIQEGKFLILIDPLEISPGESATLLEVGDPAAILLTNSNHERGAVVLKKRLNVPVGATAEAFGELSFMPDFVLNDVPRIHGLEPILLPGGALGEVSFFHARTKSLILGDAIHHLDKAGPAILPGKYCTDEALLKMSLARLLTVPFENVFFAHGSPILKNAKAKLEKLLN